MWLTVLAVCLIHFAMAASLVRGGHLNAEVSGSSSALARPSRALKRSKAIKASPVQVVGAAVKAAPASFDSKAALQLLTTFAVWYGFNAACK